MDNKIEQQLQLVDGLRIQVLVDNVTDSLSSVPKHVTHGMAYLRQQGMSALSGECLCCGAHGLSLLSTTFTAEAKHIILFDAGPERAVNALGNMFGDEVVIPYAMGRIYNF